MEQRYKDVLEVLLASQNKQRLKDVGTCEALLKEKEALDAFLAALTSVTENSLAKVSALKSRIEVSIQEDKKQIRSELLLRDKTISELQENIKELNKKHAVDLEAIQSKLIIERQEREKESNNYMDMIRELQKLWVDERRLKENLEIQLKDLKMQFSNVDDSDSEIYELPIEPHAVASETEQRQAHTPEERTSLAALHEDHVANLEARLSELSATVGIHDRLGTENLDLKQTVEDQKNRIKILHESVRVLNESVRDKSKLRADLNACKSENSNLKHTVEVQKNRIQALQENVKALNESVKDKKRLRADLNACQSENSDLKAKVENQKKNLKSLNAKLRL